MSRRQEELQRLAARDARTTRTQDPFQTGVDPCFNCGKPVGKGNIGACDDCFEAHQALEREMEVDFWAARGLL